MQEEDEPSFSQVMLVITNQQHQDQRQRQQEREEEREEHRARYEDQRDERRLQMQMHQESMRQQSQFMTTIMLAMMGGNRQFQFPNTPQTLPPFDLNNNDVHRQTGRDATRRDVTEDGKTEENEGEADRVAES